MRKTINLDNGYIIQYHTDNLLGEGTYGKVYRAVLIKKNKFWYSIFKPRDKEDLIIKILKNKHRSVTEIECLLELQEDPHVVHINKVCGIYGIKKGFIGMEYCRGGDLCDYRAKQHRDPFSEQELIVLLKQIVKTIDECHKHYIVHGDIKPDNIGLVKEGDISDIRLLDFGSAYKIKYPNDQTRYPSHTFRIHSSPYYIPPELIDFEFLLRECDLIYIDMWELGILCYVLLLGCYPFGNKTKEPRMVFEEILHNELTWPENSTISDDAKEFISVLLQKNPQNRKITYTYFDN